MHPLILGWYQVIFDAFMSAVTIIVHSAGAIQIGGNCLTLPMVNLTAPGGKSDISRLWTPIRCAKIKRPCHLNIDSYT